MTIPVEKSLEDWLQEDLGRVITIGFKPLFAFAEAIEAGVTHSSLPLFHRSLEQLLPVCQPGEDLSWLREAADKLQKVDHMGAAAILVEHGLTTDPLMNPDEDTTWLNTSMTRILAEQEAAQIPVEPFSLEEWIAQDESHAAHLAKNRAQGLIDAVIFGKVTHSANPDDDKEIQTTRKMRNFMHYVARRSLPTQ